MSEAIIQIVALLGSLAVLAAYGASQTRRLSTASLPYILLNLARLGRAGDRGDHRAAVGLPAAGRGLGAGQPLEPPSACARTRAPAHRTLSDQDSPP